MALCLLKTAQRLLVSSMTTSLELVTPARLPSRYDWISTLRLTRTRLIVWSTNSLSLAFGASSVAGSQISWLSAPLLSVGSLCTPIVDRMGEACLRKASLPVLVYDFPPKYYWYPRIPRQYWYPRFPRTSKTTSRPLESTIILRGSALGWSLVGKILGVWFGRSLLFNHHFSNL